MNEYHQLGTNNRRRFLTTSGAAVVTSLLGTRGAYAETDLKTKQLKIGVTGLGHRGAGAVKNAMDADSNVILWAVGDTDEERSKKYLEGLKKEYGERIQCEGRTFYGYDSFDKVSSEGIDIIFLTTSPAFRPAQIKRSFEKGLHVFAEKPWCIDSPGLRMVKDAVEAANKKGLSFLTGLVWRYTEGAQKVYQSLHSGELGDIMTAQGYYHAWQGNWEKGPIDTTKVNTLHQYNKSPQWFNFADLSGDWVMELYIHTIDKLSWAMNDNEPTQCYGVCGRVENDPVRNISKHFNVTYEYDDSRRAYLNGSRLSRYAAIHEEVFASKGMTRLSNGRTFIKKEGKIIYQMDSLPLGYQTEHEVFLKHIREGKVFTDIKSSHNTHLMALMGRMAAYSGQEIYPEDVLESEDVFFDSEKQWDYDSPFKPRPYATPLNYKL